MADQNADYSQYTPESGGRLFSSAMFGFNKEEVLEYLEEITAENYQKQEAAERRIQELTAKIEQLKVATGQPLPEGAGGDVSAELESQRAQLEMVNQELQAARAATQQSEEALNSYNEQLYNLQQENTWLRDEYQRAQDNIAYMGQQLNEATDGYWADQGEQIFQMQEQLYQAQQHVDYLNEQLAQAPQNSEWEAQNAEIQNLQHQLDEADLDITELQNQLHQSDADVNELQRQLDESLAVQQNYVQPYMELETAQQQAAAIVAQANAEADHIRDEMNAEKERIHRQLRHSSSGLITSISNLRGEIADVEGNVGKALESMQNTLSEVITALARTEQNLGTFGVQVDRFPSNSPAVTKAQSQPLYVYSNNDEREMPPPREQDVEPGQKQEGAALRKVITTGGAKNTLKPFRPTYSTSPTAGSPYWPQTAEAYDTNVVESRETRLRNLSESLADTLRQMMEE